LVRSHLTAVLQEGVGLPPILGTYVVFDDRDITSFQSGLRLGDGAWSRSAHFGDLVTQFRVCDIQTIGSAVELQGCFFGISRYSPVERILIFLIEASIERTGCVPRRFGGHGD